MDQYSDFEERFALQAATIDELLSDAFRSTRGQKTTSGAAAQRLAAWCRSAASGDWEQFARRLARDGLTLEHVLPRLASVQRNPAVRLPWLEDSVWVDAALRTRGEQGEAGSLRGGESALPFEHLLLPLVEEARARAWAGAPQRCFGRGALDNLHYLLAQELSDLCALALYDRFQASGSTYESFVDDMQCGGMRQLFEAKPVLLRLISSLTRQWMEASREFLERLDADLPAIRAELLADSSPAQVSGVEAGLSDRHHSGRSVLVVRFEDGQKVVYKPKDLRLDAAWANLVDRLNSSGAPIDLKSPRVLTRAGYGWSEFIEHVECTGLDGFDRFFRRGGAWLCLFHTFCATDMHDENLIACGDYPVPVDLEMLLQSPELAFRTGVAEVGSLEVAARRIQDSVLATGLLPNYWYLRDAVISNAGLMESVRRRREPYWENVNTRFMKPALRYTNVRTPNVACFEGRVANPADFADALEAGYKRYAAFLSAWVAANGEGALFDAFAELPVRQLLKPTQFYAGLMKRLKDHRNMADGAEWSSHLDFVARLSDWSKPVDQHWPLMRAERNALAGLNVPHFVCPTDSDELSDGAGLSTRTGAAPGLTRARARFSPSPVQDIAWQCDIIRLSISPVRQPEGSGDVPASQTLPEPDYDVFADECREIFGHLLRQAIRTGPGATWIGLEAVGDADARQVATLDQSLYKGGPGVSVFLAAYARLSGDRSAAALALAGVSAIRYILRKENAAIAARSMGVGAGTGLASVVYSLTLLAGLLDDQDLLADALHAASLFTGDLIAADRSLDVMGGSAGGILGLLALHRVTGEHGVLRTAERCGDHLLSRRRDGVAGMRTWRGQMPRALNGMSHGAAGFAYALASLAAATGRSDLSAAAQECIAFENAGFSPAESNWPDFQDENAVAWPCHWCHGAAGIGLARAATADRSGRTSPFPDDIAHAVRCARNARSRYDHLCCGQLGSIELLNQADRHFPGLRDEAARRLMAMVTAARGRGDYRWDAGDKRFNLSLFRGIAGVGYTLLRQLDPSLPNLLVWE